MNIDRINDIVNAPTRLLTADEKDLAAVISARLEAKADGDYRWPRWAAAEEAAQAASDLLCNIETPDQPRRQDMAWDNLPPAARDTTEGDRDVLWAAVLSVYKRHDDHAPLNHVNVVEWVDAVLAAGFRCTTLDK